VLPVKEILDYYEIRVIKNNPNNENIYCCCPFHEGTGRTPQNFSINRYNGLWCCFAKSKCGSGNIIHFIKRIEDCGTSEAKAILKREFRAGEVSWKSVLRSCSKDKKTLNSAPTVAKGKIPSLKRLPHNHPWIKSREYTYSLCEDFGMQYAPENLAWVWWPIAFKGQTMGHSSRHVNRDAKHKWWHQPGLPKSEILYNFDRAVKSDLVIVCEGILDVMRLKMLGFPGAVAIFGATAQDEQIALIVSGWDRIVVCLDGDVAGIEGAEKLCTQLSKHSSALLTRVTMPYDVDVDDLRSKDQFITQCRRGGVVLRKKKVAPTWGDLLRT
jgi:DNA primase